MASSATTAESQTECQLFFGTNVELELHADVHMRLHAKLPAEDLEPPLPGWYIQTDLTYPMDSFVRLTLGRLQFPLLPR